MSFRSSALPSLFVVLGVVALACGDDDSSPASTPDGGPSSSSGSPSSSSGGTQGVKPTFVTGAALPNIVIGVAAAPAKLTASGDATIVYALTAGATPPGMTFNNGDYTGTPTTIGSYNFTITATNGFGNDTRAFTQKVISPPADAVVLLGNNQISPFATAAPAGASAPVTITGVATSDTLVAIDRRPMNGQLYALGFNATAGSVTLYAVHLGANVAVPVGTAQTFDSAIVGTGFGLDVNPAVDRIRVVTSAGQNFRMNPNTGAVVDTDASAGNGIQRDGAINGGATTASETAYTNNQINNGTITTQYTISGGSLYVQNPPNTGTLTSALAMPNVASVFGFDIAPGVNAAASNTAVTAGTGYAVATLTGQTAQVGGTVNLVTGAFTSQGEFPSAAIKGLALAQSATRSIVALSADGLNLIRFNEATPATTATQAITGVTAGEQLVGIDFRPATGQLYALGVNATTNLATAYVLDPTTGAATAVAAGGVAFLGIDLPDPATAGYGFDFNSSVDRIRVVTSTGLNFRIHPDTGAGVDGDANTVGVQPDTALTFGALSGVAYTNGHPAVLPGVATEYGIDAATNSLHHVANPNQGNVGPATPIKLGGAALDFSAVAGFDIPQSIAVAANNAPVTAGSAYAALAVGGVTSLYKIDLVTGNATLIGPIGAGTTSLHGIAVGQ